MAKVIFEISRTEFDAAMNESDGDGFVIRADTGFVAEFDKNGECLDVTRHSEIFVADDQIVDNTTYFNEMEVRIVEEE